MKNLTSKNERMAGLTSKKIEAHYDKLDKMTQIEKTLITPANKFSSKNVFNAQNDLINVDGFIWLGVTAKAWEVFKTGLFDVFVLNDDGSESEVEDLFDIEDAMTNHLKIGIEVGYLKKD